MTLSLPPGNFRGALHESYSTQTQAGERLAMEAFRFEQWREWCEAGFTLLPVASVHRGASLPANWATLTTGSASVLLESAQGGRYTFFCDRPDRIIMGDAHAADVWSGDAVTKIERQVGGPFEVLSSFLSSVHAPSLHGWPAMTGGLMGIFGYDLVRLWERLPCRADRDISLPLYALLRTRELFIYDHQESTLGIVAWREVPMKRQVLEATFRDGEHAVADAWLRWQAVTPSTAPRRRATAQTRSTEKIRQSLSGEQFQSAARVALNYIAAGDTYQVNLSLRTSRETSVSPVEIYDSLRQVNPSPYMGLLRLPGFSLVCGSPELLVRLVDGIVSSRPIAGTRPRGAIVEQDTRLAAELITNEKERAEHLMLVDLIRNDIGRVAAFGSVVVSEYMAVEQYSHVMHIVSQVEGRLASGQTWREVLKSMFPGGTITGCPKIRTMEIIEELEPVGRGFYTGALGWISYAGEMEMNIVIRSMLVKDDVAHVQAGAGIVADSIPERELDEALRKAEALWVALDRATIS
ncbi:MAG: anthranilate synthase component I family protein [Opitutus sp.]